MQTSIIGRIRKVLEALDAGGQAAHEELQLSNQLELLTAPGAMEAQETVRAGRAFWSGNTTAVAAVVAPPTTGVNFALYNNDADGGRSLVIDWVAALNIVSTAVVCQAQMLGNIGQVRETAPANSAMTVKRRNGKGPNNDTVAYTIIGGTALPATTGIAANWFPIGQAATKPSAVATPGYGCFERVRGDIICPPGRYFALNVQANVVGETFVTFIGWHEKKIELG